MSPCIEKLSETGPSVSPFERLLAFDVYDGPTSGLVICPDGDDVFFFRMLAWDEERDRRVFSLSRVPTEVVKWVIALLESFETPRWPEWWLRADWNEEQRRRADQALARIISEAGPVEWVVVCTRMLESIEFAKRIRTEAQRASLERMSKRSTEEAEVSELPFSKWLELVAEVTN